MKKLLYILMSIALVFSFSACSSEEPISYDGEWYAVNNGDMYLFKDGNIISDEHFFTSDNGEKLTGAYGEYEGYINAFAVGVTGLYDLKHLYIVEVDGHVALSDSPDETGTVYFYREKEVAQALYENEMADFEDYLQQNATPSPSPVPSNPDEIPTVTFDSIVKGDHTNETINIEAIISDIEYSESIQLLNCNLWYWSDNENTYICDELCSLWLEDIKQEDIDLWLSFEEGDKLRLTLEIYEDDSFGLSSYIAVKHLEKGKLADYGIVKPTPTPEPTPELNEEDRYVYIADSGTKYHTANCRWVSDSRHKISYDEAKARGYSSCDTCNPRP